MKTKDLMTLVDKPKAVQFMTRLKELTANKDYRWGDFNKAVSQALNSIDILEPVNGTLAQGVVTAMEKKSNITY